MRSFQKNGVFSLLACFQYQHLSLALHPFHSRGCPRRIHLSVKFSAPSYQLIGSPQQPLSSSRDEQQHPVLGYSTPAQPYREVCLSRLIVENGRTWMQHRDCKWFDNLKLKKNVLKSDKGQPQGEQCVLSIRLHPGCYGNHLSHPPFRQI